MLNRVAINRIASSNFDNWVRPSTEQIRLEYFLEVQIKDGRLGWWPGGWCEFLQKVEEAEVVRVDSKMGSKIRNRTFSQSQDELNSILRGYASWGTFRTEETTQNLYDVISGDKPSDMNMPIVVRFANGTLFILGGNTRMDVAYQLGVEPEVLVVDSDYNQRDGYNYDSELDYVSWRPGDPVEDCY